MLTNEFRRMSLRLLLAAPGSSLGYGCSGKIATEAAGADRRTGRVARRPPVGDRQRHDARGNVDAGGVTAKPTTFTPALAGPTCRKVKDLLVGMPCTTRTSTRSRRWARRACSS